MVDLSGGGQDGHIEHKFSDWIFVGPAILVIALVSKLILDCSIAHLNCWAIRRCVEMDSDERQIT